MKKQYIKPQVQVAEISSNCIMAASLTDDGKSITTTTFPADIPEGDAADAAAKGFNVWEDE